MNSAVLKWLANGMICVVVVSTLWIAQAVQPGQPASSLLMAQAVAAPADAASSPTVSR